MLAFTFPGQGSQKPGMGAEWVDHESWELVEEASQACGRDVTELLLHADADELKQTHQIRTRRARAAHAKHARPNDMGKSWLFRLGS